MRNMMLGVAGGVALTLVLVTLARLEPEAFAQRPTTAPMNGPGILMANSPTAGGGQQIVVVDTSQRVIGSYQIAPSGEIALKGIRNIRYDLLMEEFNGGEPKPRDIRALLDQK